MNDLYVGKYPSDPENPDEGYRVIIYKRTEILSDPVGHRNKSAAVLIGMIDRANLTHEAGKHIDCLHVWDDTEAHFERDHQPHLIAK